MKLSDVIEHLQYLHDSLGDIDVMRSDSDSMKSWYKFHIDFDRKEPVYMTFE